MRPSTLSTRAEQTACPPSPHRHLHGQLTCARCGVTDATVAQTITRTGEKWDPLCSSCSAKVARMAALALPLADCG